MAGFVLGGGLLIALSIPLIQRRVKPNNWYGFRTPRTLKDPNVWYPANEFAAKRMLWVGVAMIGAAVICYFIPNLSLEIYASIIGAVAVIGLIIGAFQSFAFHRQLPEKKSDDGPKA